MTTLNVSPAMLHWAAQRLGTSVAGLADEMAAPSRVEKFAGGTLTIGQALELASKARIPFGYLFLSEPPADRQPPIPDLRQTIDPEPLDAAFFDLLEDVEAKRAWFAQHLRENDIPGPPFVGKFAGKGASHSAVAAHIRHTIGLKDADREACRTPDKFYDLLAERFEAEGLLVFRSGVAKGNPHRPLAVSQFRGFAIADPLVPVVFVNGRDAPAAWIFTLLHEAAHVWLGVSGVSDSSASVPGVPEHQLEAFCNRVAAEVLVPEDEFHRAWRGDRSGAPILALSRAFVVSRLVIARRALDAGLISQAEYEQVRTLSMPTRTTAGGNPYATIPIRSSRRFTRVVLDSAMAGETMLREAARLLNVRPGTVVELHRRRNERHDTAEGADA